MELKDLEIRMGNCRKERQKGREEGREAERERKRKKGRKEERKKGKKKGRKKEKSEWGRLSGHVTATLSGMYMHCLTQEHHSFPLQTLVLLLQVLLLNLSSDFISLCLLQFSSNQMALGDVVNHPFVCPAFLCP